VVAFTPIVAREPGKRPRFQLRITLGEIELGQVFLAGQDALDRRPLELHAEDTAAVGLPPVLAHGPPAASYVPGMSIRNGEHSNKTIDIPAPSHWTCFILVASKHHACLTMPMRRKKAGG
jgi:hypothetical protein